MDDLVLYESLKIAKWKTDKFQKMYDTHLEKMIEEFVIYVNENKYGEIVFQDIVNSNNQHLKLKGDR